VSGAKLTKERDARREAGIKKLAKLYEGMDPEAAASILSKLEKNMAAEVLGSMKDRQASKVLAAMNGQKARDLSERLQEARLDQTAGQGKAPFDQAQGRLRPGSRRAAEETP
jgi:flagellar motility protein MotE (MotC chaperone)